MSAPRDFRAFPNGPDHADFRGMTLRDYFAGQALNAIVAENGSYERIAHLSAKEAYAMADAMLAERAKGGAA